LVFGTFQRCEIVNPAVETSNIIRICNQKQQKTFLVSNIMNEYGTLSLGAAI